MKQAFSATIEERESDTLIARLHGAVCGSTEAYALPDDLRDRIAAGRRKVVPDLSLVYRSAAVSQGT